VYWYYPSCNFQRLFPGTAAKIRAYMETQADVRVAGCCHVTNGQPAQGDSIVTVCTSCTHILRELRSDVPVMSLYAFMLTRGGFTWPDHSGERAALQDCFRARGDRALQDDVRACLALMGMDIAEVPPCRDEADFDGAFLLRRPPERNEREAPGYFVDYLPAHLTVLPESAWKAVFKRRADVFGGMPVVTYCNTCQTGLEEGGADARHIASLMFP